MNDDQSSAAQAKDKAQDVAQEGVGRAKGMMRDQVDQRSTQAGERVTSTASDVRSISEQLRQQGKDQPAKLAEQAADRAERLGDYLQRSDADRILHDVEAFGRKQPWAVVAGGLALGFAASRFLKASSERRQTSGDWDAYRTPQATPPSLTAAGYGNRAGSPDAGYDPAIAGAAAPIEPVDPIDPVERDIVVTGDISSGTARGGV
jgi:hypothetical protein